MNRLKNKVIVVTGGSGLIGQSIIKQVCKEGGLAINADIIHSTNIQEGLVNCDVTDINSVQKCINILISEYGKIDNILKCGLAFFLTLKDVLYCIQVTNLSEVVF